MHILEEIHVKGQLLKERKEKNNNQNSQMPNSNLPYVSKVNSQLKIYFLFNFLSIKIGYWLSKISLLSIQFLKNNYEFKNIALNIIVSLTVRFVFIKCHK